LVEYLGCSNIPAIAPTGIAKATPVFLRLASLRRRILAFAQAQAQVAALGIPFPAVPL